MNRYWSDNMLTLIAYFDKSHTVYKRESICFFFSVAHKCPGYLCWCLLDALMYLMWTTYTYSTTCPEFLSGNRKVLVELLLWLPLYESYSRHNFWLWGLLLPTLSSSLSQNNLLSNILHSLKWTMDQTGASSHHIKVMENALYSFLSWNPGEQVSHQVE